MKKILTIVPFVLLCFFLQAQVAIENIAPTPAQDASAALQVTSIGNNKGVLVPRLLDYQIAAIATPANGLLVFDLTNNVFKYNEGTSIVPNWVQIGAIAQTVNPATIIVKDGGDVYFNTATLNINYYNEGSAIWRKFKKSGNHL